jgi:hypothetical protein
VAEGERRLDSRDAASGDQDARLFHGVTGPGPGGR